MLFKVEKGFRELTASEHEYSDRRHLQDLCLKLVCGCKQYERIKLIGFSEIEARNLAMSAILNTSNCCQKKKVVFSRSVNVG